MPSDEKTTRISLNDYRSRGGKVFAGRERGEKVRHAAQLTTLDQQDVSVSVFIPEDVFSVNSSFFLGMFGESVRKLGEEGFRAHYRFEGKDITDTVEDGIREALAAVSPLDNPDND
jgi:hypothetical protein